jgi:predicted aminopeptidase
MRTLRAEAVSLTVSLFGGRGEDGKRVDGALGELDDLRRDVAALQAQRRGHFERWIAAGISAAILALGKLLDYLTARH